MIEREGNITRCSRETQWISNYEPKSQARIIINNVATWLHLKFVKEILYNTSIIIIRRTTIILQQEKQSIFTWRNIDSIYIYFTALLRIPPIVLKKKKGLKWTISGTIS